MRGLTSFAGKQATDRFLDGLSANALCSLPWLFECWAIPGHQLPPPGAWKTWVILGGRGAGKTRAGAEWVRAEMEGATPLSAGPSRKMALVADTLDQGRDIMVHGVSGILAVSPPDRRPVWQAERHRLVWPNGAVAEVFSASDPERLRGPQFDAAWCDELAKWKKAEDTWDMLQFGLRLGRHPRQVVTTTPKNQDLLKDLLARTDTVVTHGTTWDNAANLAPDFIAQMRARYDGSPKGRQELDGELIEENAGALWSPEVITRARISGTGPCDRIVVAVDPPASATRKSDECGILVVGVTAKGPPQDWRAVVLEDASARSLSPEDWGRRVVEAYWRHGAQRVIAEVNQGGDMVGHVIHTLDPSLPFRPVRAREGKALRAEPVAMLYAQGRVGHLGRFRELEDQMLKMTATGFAGRGSPDRLDALVWALTDLMIEPLSRHYARPGIRSLERGGSAGTRIHMETKRWC